MQVQRSETVTIGGPEDVVAARQVVRREAVAMGFSLVDQTKVVTATSELARNALVYGGGGSVRVAVVEQNARMGLRIEFVDEGPGIPDIERALQDGFTSGQGMGLGLGGAKRLSHEFSIESEVGRGTRVTIVRWKS